MILGLPALHAKLARLQVGAEAIADAAVDTYAEGIAQDAQTRAPVETGRLRDSIEATDDAVVATAEYAAFVELGTVNMSPQPYMRPAADTAEQHTPKAATVAGAVVKAITR